MSYCSVFDLSNYIISKIDFINNLKLQKILYFCQIRVLVEFNRPLFNEDIEAWSFGPVVPYIYNKYTMFGASSIPKFNIQENLSIPQEVKNAVDEMISCCCKYSTCELTNISMKSEPYKIARYDTFDLKIRNSDMIKYYKK